MFRYYGTEHVKRKETLVDDHYTLSSEGNIQNRDRAVIVDDVITTGRSVLESLHFITTLYPDIEIVGILCLVLRQSSRAPEWGKYPVFPVIGNRSAWRRTTI